MKNQRINTRKKTVFELSGQRFGKLLVLGEIKPDQLDPRYIDRANYIHWMCACDCGGDALIPTGKLLSGHTTCCPDCGPGVSITYKELLGRTVGRLTVVEDSGERWNRQRVMRCRCSCGEEKLVRAGHLKQGTVLSCGCLHRDSISLARGTHRECNTPTYVSWTSMKTRCLNPNQPNWKYYGERGVTICSRWLEPASGYQNFKDDLGTRPAGLTLDRIDVHGNYEPGNCRWATIKEQNTNRRI